jgi:hypothetical protein
LNNHFPHIVPHRASGLRLLATLIAFLFLQTSQGQSDVQHSQVKAAYLYNFTHFVKWPPAAFESNTAPFIIGILGNDPFGKHLDALVAEERVEGHAVTVQRFANAADIKNCHILYINLPNAAEVVKSFAGRSILTVSDGNFAQQGGMVGFIPDAKRVRLQISQANARTAGLHISAKLLRLAEVVDKQP